MNVIVDIFINLLKWPVAIFLLFSVPALIQSLDFFKFSEFRYMAMAAGFFLFFIARSFMDGTTRVGLEVAAHELTHAFFALLTFHKVKGIRINPDDTGGAMSFEGEGNWLIIIAPYFFPLYALFVMGGISLYTMFAPTNLILNIILGFFTGFHFDMVGSQIHEKQTDLPKVGYPFCAAFLFPANLWMVGSILAFNSKSWDGVVLFSKLILRLNDKNIDKLLGLLGF